MGAQAKGYQAVVGLYEEGTYGVVPGSPDGKKLYIVSSTLNPTRPLIQANTLRGDRTQGAPDNDNLDVGGGVVTEIGTQNIGLLIKHLLGLDTPTGSGPYVHVFTCAPTLPVGLMMEFDHGTTIASTQVERYNGLKVASATFDIPQKGYPTIKWAFVGSGYSLQASPADATLTDSGQTSMSAFRGALQEGGSSIATVLSGSIMVNNDLDTSQYTVGGGAGGAGTRADLPEGFCLVSGTITFQFKDATLLNKALNGTDTSLEYTLQNGTGDGSAGNEYLDINVKHMKYELAGPQINGPKGITVTLKFMGYSLSSNFITITLKNLTATY